jgi:glycosyltransferase involved in cell wall biosynthesis
MKVLKVSQSYFPYLEVGGPPAKIRGLAAALTIRGHEVTILTADLGVAAQEKNGSGARKGKSQWGWEAQRKEGHAIYLSTMANYRIITLNPKVISFCLARLRDFEVVHIYGLYDLLGATVAWFCRRWKIPYLVEPIGMFHPKVRSQRKKRLYHKLLGSALIEGARFVIATSEKERAELIDGGLNVKKIVLRRNGIDLNPFLSLPARGTMRASWKIGDAELLILFLGRISYIKGLDLLVKAFARLEQPARLVIAGPDDRDGCSEKIKRLREELKLGDRLIISNAIYNEQKIQALVDADIFVLPSSYESFGNAAAEAMACGTPVIVTDQCGIAPLVQDQAGLVAAHNIVSLQQAMTLLLQDETMRQLFQSGALRVAQKLSWDEPAAQMESLYQQLLASPAAQITPSLGLS